MAKICIKYLVNHSSNPKKSHIFHFNVGNISTDFFFHKELLLGLTGEPIRVIIMFFS